MQGTDAPHSSRVENRLRMRQIALMLAIDEHRTLRAAAAALNMTQPAATRMLKELEEAFGQLLFTRDKRGLKLNAAGEAVTHSCRTMRNTLGALEQHLFTLRQASEGPVLRLGCTDEEWPDSVYTALQLVRRRFPQTTVQLQTAALPMLQDMLQHDRLQAFVARVPTDGRAQWPLDLRVHPLESDALVAVLPAHHPLFHTFNGARTSVRLKDVAGWTWVVPGLAHPARVGLDALLHAQQMQPREGWVEVPNLITAARLMARGDSVLLWSANGALSLEQVGKFGCWPVEEPQQPAMGQWALWTSAQSPVHAPLMHLQEQLLALHSLQVGRATVSSSITYAHVGAVDKTARAFEDA